MNAILYINKTGCQWRLLPRKFGPWQTVYYYFRKWEFEGVFDDIIDTLHSLVRKLISMEDTMTSDNLGFRLENIVYIELLRRYKGENISVFYYRDNFGVDFIIVDKTKVLELIQVTHKMDKQTTRTRELGGLKKGAELLKCEKLTLLSLSERGVEEYEGHRINKYMIVDWLLGNQ